MNRILLVLFSLLFAFFTASANYTLYSFSGNISLRQGGSEITPVKGMKVGAADEITIGPGGSVEIYNAATKEIFRSVGEGKTSVMGIMLDARKQSGNSMGAINDRWTMSKNGGSGNNRLYTEGMVKRSFNVYDPAAENKEIDSHQLALHLYNAIKTSSGKDLTKSPTEITSDRPALDGLNFSVSNTLTHPVYLNVIKIDETSLGSVELSELGQPMSSYVILPGQTISRGQVHGLRNTDSHFIILTYCRFDIDNLIEDINSLLKNASSGQADAELPVFIGRL